MMHDPRIHSSLEDLLAIRNDAKSLTMRSGHASPVASSGSHRTNARGRGIEFEEVRHYQPGDDVRAIDWRVTARLGKAHTKIFREEKERPLLVLIDQRQSMFFGSQKQFKSVFAAKLAALYLWQGMHSGDRIGGIVLGNQRLSEIKAARGKRNALRLIGELSEINQSLHNPFNNPEAIIHDMASSLFKMGAIAKPGSHIVIFSDCYDLDDRVSNELWRLSQHSRVDIIHILDPIERELPQRGIFGISDGQNKQFLNVDNAQKQREFKEYIRQHQHSIEQLCQKTGCFYREINSDLAPLDAYKFLQLTPQRLTP
jgi:uncharacterized protein (DUF58 family)